MLAGLIYMMARGPASEDFTQELIQQVLAILSEDKPLTIAQFQEVADTLEEALEVNPDSEETLTVVREVQSRIGEQLVDELQAGRLATVQAMLAIAQSTWPDVQRFSVGGEIDNKLQKELDIQRLMNEVSDIIGQAKDAIAFNEGGSHNQRLESIKAALEQLKLALALDPSNEEAVTMQSNLRAQLTDQIESAIQASEPEEAKELLEVAQGYFEKDGQMEGLRERTQRLEASIGRESQIGEILATAQQRVASDSLMVPHGDSAVDYFEQVLEIDPNNREAIGGIEKVADRYAQLASSAISQGNVSTAESYVNNISELRPEHVEIQNLRERIRERNDAIANSTPRTQQSAQPKPTVSAPSPAKPEIIPMDDEDRIWIHAQGTCNRAALQKYIDTYPSGRYADDAWRELSSCLDSN